MCEESDIGRKEANGTMPQPHVREQYGAQKGQGGRLSVAPTPPALQSYYDRQRANSYNVENIHLLLLAVPCSQSREKPQEVLGSPLKLALLCSTRNPPLEFLPWPLHHSFQISPRTPSRAEPTSLVPLSPFSLSFTLFTGFPPIVLSLSLSRVPLPDVN